MSKILTKIIGACLGLSLATGVGVGIVAGNDNHNNISKAEAAEVVAYTFDGSSAVSYSGNAYAVESTITQNYVTWGVFGNTEIEPWRIGGQKITKVDREIYTKESLSYHNITKVTIEIGTATINVNSLTLKVGTSAKSDDVSSLTATFSANSTITFEKPAGADWIDKYFDFVFNVTNNGNSNKFLQFSNATFYRDSSEPELESVEITGNLSKTSYTYGEAWSHSGLSLLGHFADDSSRNIASAISWSYNPGSASPEVTSLTVTATIEGKSASRTFNLSVSKVASPYFNGVPYKMYLHNTIKNKNYYFIGSMNGYYGATIDDVTSTTIVDMYFEPSGDGQAIYFYAGNDTTAAKQYLGISTNDGHVNFTFGSSASVFYYNGKSMVTYVSSADGIYGMGTYGSLTTFGASASYQVSNYFAQFELVNALTAEDFATQLLDIIACDSTGETAPTYNYNYTWQDLNNLFDQLSSSEQLILKNADITDSGTIADAMARYDLIIAKYGYDNFIGREISNSANRIVNFQENSDVMIVIVIISFFMVTGICGSILIRKKKEN